MNKNLNNIKDQQELHKLLTNFKYSKDKEYLKKLWEEINYKFSQYLRGNEIISYVKLSIGYKKIIDDYILSVENNCTNKDNKDKMVSFIEELRNFI